MERYRDLSGNSGVAAYEIGDDWIAVEFKTGAAYLYTEASAGARRIAEMKILARRGQGLSTFIAQQVGKAYAAKLR